MPQKLTISSVKEFVKTASDGLCCVLDDEYVNDRSPLKIQCKCGRIFYRDFHHIRRGQLYCDACKWAAASERNRKPVEQLISEIEKTGCSYISGEYVNNKSVLTIRCRCGNVFQKKAIKFFSGQDRCQECGKKLLVAAKTKYTVDDVQKEISKDGYTIVDKSKYIDSTHGVRCLCSNGHEFDLVFGNYLRGSSGCKACAYAAMSGENHWNYQGGKADVLDSLRKAVKPWKSEIKALYNGKCAISGETPKRLDVHHLDNLLDIIDQCSKETGVEFKPQLSDYSDYSDYEKLKNAVISKHSLDVGIAISHSIHAKFHKKYAGKRTTREQFSDFVLENYGVSLDEIMLTTA